MHIEELQTPSHGVDIEMLAQLHHVEFGGVREFSSAAVAATCFNFTLDKQREQVNCWIAYNSKGEAVGYLAATIERSFYSFRHYAVQQMWYVVPQYRTGQAASALIMAYEEWAIKRHCERIYTQVEHDSDPSVTERVFKFLTFLGYNKQGYIAVKVTNIKQDETDDPGTHRELGAEQAQVK